jgi:3-oxoadipate enol-lactonase
MMRLRAEQAAQPKTEEVLRGERLQLIARIGHDVADRLHNVASPTFVMAGRFDGIAPPDNSHEIVKRIPHATMAEYEGGHMFVAQDKLALKDLWAFLSGGSSAQSGQS